MTSFAAKSPFSVSELVAPLDRLGLVTLLSSLYFLQMFFLLPLHVLVLPREALLVLAGLGILFPRFWPLLVINASIFLVAYIQALPVASNNQTTAVFLAAIIICACIVTLVGRRGPESASGFDRERFFGLIASPGRWLLAGLYFYGIYHKINTDFLDPTVSCAVELYRPLAAPFGLDNWTFGHYGAIYATFVIEGFAMFALFSKRYKWLGLAVGIPFHVIIGWTGYAYYKDFSTIVLVLYALFLPRETMENYWAASLRFFADETRAKAFTFLVQFTLAVLACGAMVLWKGFYQDQWLHYFFVPVFTLYSIIYYSFVLGFTPFGGGETDYRFSWLFLFPILFFANGLSPYLGLKTESSIAMFSNLHTEGGQTNHLIHGVLPFGWDYQEEVVEVTGSNDPKFNARHIGKSYVRYDFDNWRNRYDEGLVVQTLINGEPVEFTSETQNTYLETPWLLQKYLRFKPVDFERPKVCTH